MRPTPSLRLLGPKVKPFHDPWHRREAWRYQAPFKPNGGVLAYQTWWKPTVVAFLGWVAWDEVVNHGPLKKYVWGETDHSHTDPHAAPSH